jgi:alcohol dehydrogenase class IV
VNTGAAVTSWTPPWGTAVAEQHAFLSPREVRAGDGAAATVGELVARWASPPGRVLLVCDPALPGLGLTGAVESSLADAGFEVDVFAEVTAEPDVAVAAAAADQVHRGDHVAVVGMGGGSSMDVAKVAAALATNPGDVAGIVGADRIATAPLPLVLVPTTAGTGAEATRIAILSEAGEKRIVNSAHLVPVAAVLDPLLVAGLPPAITASTGLDALSHAIEALLATSASALTARMSLEALELLATALPQAFADGSDLHARRGTLYGAYLAGLALNAGVVLGHSIAYTIANRVHLPHGITAAMALPYCLAYDATATAPQLEAIVAKLPGADGDVYRWLADLNSTLGVPPSLRVAGIPADEITAMAAECEQSYPRPTNPVPLEREPLTELYRHLWSGDLEGCVDALAK